METTRKQTFIDYLKNLVGWGIPDTNIGQALKWGPLDLVKVEVGRRYWKGPTQILELKITPVNSKRTQTLSFFAHHTSKNYKLMWNVNGDYFLMDKDKSVLLFRIKEV